MIAATTPLSGPQKAWLAAEVVATYARVRMLIRRTDLRSTLRSLRSVPSPPARPAGEDKQQAGDRLGRAVDGTLPRLPVDSSCLLKSLTLSRMLARRGIDSVLVIGVDAPGQDFGAHAWVEVDGRALLEPGGEKFPRLVDL